MKQPLMRQIPEPVRSPASKLPGDFPESSAMVSIMGSTFTIDNNNLAGPQSGQATEHQVTLSDYILSEAEITNAQYLEFLNAAFDARLVEVTTATEGADIGKAVFTETSSRWSAPYYHGNDHFGFRVAL